METIRDDYYSKDSPLVPACLVNGKNAYSEFNAWLREYYPSSNGIDLSYRVNVSKSKFALYESKYKESKMTFSFNIGGNSYQDAMMNVNMLLAEVRECTIVVDGDEYEYECILSSYSVDSCGLDWFFDVELSFYAIRRFPLVTKEFSASTSISFMNFGALKSGMRLTVTSTSARTNIVVDGIKIASLKADVPFVLDGIEGEVMENGVNKFLDTDLTSFPKVEPGLNTLGSTYSVKWKVEFYPTFII